MMLTRCPACQTVFRLRPEQLHARRGEVRCGHCFHPFNALEHAIGIPANEAPTAPPTAPDVFVLEDKLAPMPAGQSPASMLEFGIPEPGPEPQYGSPIAARPHPASERIDSATAQQALPPVAAAYTHETASTPTDAASPRPIAGGSGTPEPAEAALPRVFPGVLRSGRRPAPLAEPATAASDAAMESPDAMPASPAEAERAQHDRAQDAAPVVIDATSPEPDLAHLDATYGRPSRKTHPVLKALGGMLVLALIALLGVQTAYLYRTEIARELPGLRPLMTEACARAGCTIPYPQDAERIAIEASDLQAEPGRPGRYLLHATLNNRAEYPQRWPHLELTLTDAGDNPMSRRVLTPADWLSAGETAEAFAARKAIELRLAFEVAGLAPTGYRVYAFYP